MGARVGAGCKRESVQSPDFDVEFQEPRGPLGSPEPLLSDKQLSGPFPAPSPQKPGLLGSQQLRTVFVGLGAAGVSPSEPRCVELPLEPRSAPHPRLREKQCA